MNRLRWRAQRACPRRGSARRALPAAVLGILLLAGCSQGYSPAGAWVVKPEGPPPVVAPPQDPGTGQPGEPAPGPEGEDSSVIASGLSVPTGLALLADGSALVGERTTGRILQVFPDASPPVEVMVVPGLDVTGDGGLLGLAVSPTFDQDRLIYAYITTPEDNRVVKFPVGGSPNAVLTDIPKGATHNGGALLFGPDGALYVGTGDTGVPDLAADEQNLAGKVLRIDIFGEPGGPDAIYTSGHSDVTALCLSPDGQLFGTDLIDGEPDELNLLVEDEEYGWPLTGSSTTHPLLEIDVPGDGLGGCALGGGSIALAALDGQRLYTSQLDAEYAPVGELMEFLTGMYGRLRTLLIDAEGALWVTTNNRDGSGTPAADDDRVLRIPAPPVGGGGGKS
ncbi:MAG: PQQ-dependent sugar dehydrogenase [Geodermatophilaceae bacterium]